MQRINITRAYLKNSTVGFCNYLGFNFATLELPWLDNQVNISCVYPGVYKAKKYNSPSLGRTVILLEDRAGRTWIEMHHGNFTHQIKGCLLVGDSIKYINGDDIPDVTNSEETLDILLDMLPYEFEVAIK